MARVQWSRARFETSAHLTVVGDVLVLCGQRMVESVPVVIPAGGVPTIACPVCVEIITEAAASLAPVEVPSHG